MFGRQFYSLKPSAGRLVILGTGWGGFPLLQSFKKKAEPFSEVILISPRNYHLFTPLLASTCVGTLEYRHVIEPVRHHIGESGIKFYEAYVDQIDLKSQRLGCKSVVRTHDQVMEGESFTLGYDKLVVAVGALSNTFNTPGVTQYAHFLKNIDDAKKIRYRILETFERASSPGLNEEQLRRLLSFVIVGGGPTGVEFAAELYDFLVEDLSRLYPRHLIDMVRVTMIDVAPTILSTFDASLSEYTMSKFQRQGIQLRTQCAVEKVESDHIVLKGTGEKLPYGLLVWNTGLSPHPLVQSLSQEIETNRAGRLVTDSSFRLKAKSPSSFSLTSSNVLPNVYAIGDCATIQNHDLPATAQVARQKAIHLGKCLKSQTFTPFVYHDAGMMAYIGKRRAIAGLNINPWTTSTDSVTSQKPSKSIWNESGFLAWLLWRSAYLTMTVSWKNKFLIPLYWVSTFIFGRDTSHLK